MPEEKERKKPYLSLSVHQLVDYLFRAGDIDNRVYNQEAMDMGSKLHSAFQKKQGHEYLSEYYLAETFALEEGTIALNGRADGIIVGGPCPIVDEIKSAVIPLTEFHQQQGRWHLSQAECYALMYMHEKDCDEIAVRLTYLSQTDSKNRLEFRYQYSREELEEKVRGYMVEYLKDYQNRFKAIEQRNHSASELLFPFSDFRPGQRDMAKYCYSVAKNGGVLFVEAPTGIGKTISALYPFVKSFALGKIDRIFYLTAKGTGRESAYDAMTLLYRKGFVGRDVFLIAKDKICFTPGASCNPDECPFAKGYYDKRRRALSEAMSSWNRFDPAFVTALARKESICPFEFQLDLSLFADVVICDYNYFFDPLVKLDRFFGPQGEGGSYLALIDEAHNLVDRGRDMYSAQVQASSIAQARRSLSKVEAPGLKRSLTKLKKSLTALAPTEDGYADSPIPPESFYKVASSFRKSAMKFNEKPHPALGEAYDDLFLEVNKYVRLIDEFQAQGSVFYAERRGREITAKLKCLDPSPFLRESIDSVKGAVLFSATFSPISYYQKTIYGEEGGPRLLLPSPFPPKNFDLLIAPKVSVRYRERSKTYQEVADYLKRFVSGKEGNYFLYLPSYEYLENISPFLDFGDAVIYRQEKEMTEDERKELIAHFQPSPEKTNVGLLILGGAFGEGIDLVSDRLIGVAIVGIGLPQIGHDNDLLREYANQRGLDGFRFAYMDPGVNRVMQAAGRLIRSETDRGACLLIDDRYLISEYRSLFSRTWKNYSVVTSPEDVSENLTTFWGREKAS